MIIFQIFNLQSFSSDPDLCLLAHPQLSKSSDNTENLHKPSCVITLDTGVTVQRFVPYDKSLSWRSNLLALLVRWRRSALGGHHCHCRCWGHMLHHGIVSH